MLEVIDSIANNKHRCFVTILRHMLEVIYSIANINTDV